MADYKRFVSYMYEYENGTKKKNVGYARVEIRNGECKFTIHMQLEGLAEGIFPTYLIHRPTDDMDLVYLGDCAVRNQLMDSRLSAKESNIMDSGYRFSDMGGVLLFLNSGVFYATQWDDKPIVLEEVLDALKPKSKIKPPEADPGKLGKQQEAVPTTVKVPDSSDTIQEEVKEKLVAAKIPSPSASIGATNSPVYRLPGGWKIKEGTRPIRPRTPVNPWELVEKYKKSTDSKSVSKESSKEKSPDEIKPIEESTKDKVQKDKDQKDISRKDILQKDQISKDTDNKESSVESPVDNFRQGEKIKTVKNIDPLGKAPWKERSEKPLAVKIFANYPRIYPFEDNEITRCVKLEPKDIGILPSDTWILSNNSFLLHGYYCYHHLIFAEIVDRYGCHYILGVPGIYHNRERFMARMFGFECFKSIRKRELKQGDFGYWYVEVKV